MSLLYARHILRGFEEQTCKPDSVASLHADGHFSAAMIARRVAVKVSPYNSSQPESSPGRVFAGLRPRFRFLLGFAPDGGYLSRRVTATLVRSYFKPLRGRTVSPLPSARPRWTLGSLHLREASSVSRRGQAPPGDGCFVSVALSRLAGSLRREVAVSDRPALWCPDFPPRPL